MRDQLENAAREVERHGRLPSAADVMRRGDQRRNRVRATRTIAAALVVVAAGGSWWLTQDGPKRSTPTPPASATTTATATTTTTTTTTPSPAPDQVAPAAPTVMFTTPDGLVLTTTTEGGAKVAPLDTIDSPTMPLWHTDPTSSPNHFLLRNGARSDDQDICLSMPSQDAVSVQTCDPASSTLSFTLTQDKTGTYTLSSQFGYVVAEADGGLKTSINPTDATAFTVADPSHPDTVPDL